MNKSLQLCILVGLLLAASCYAVYRNYVPPAPTPTCEQRGGRIERDTLVIVPIGKVPIPVHRYKCVIL